MRTEPEGHSVAVVVGSGCSSASSADDAVAEALVGVRRRLAGRPVDVALVFVSGGHVAQLEAVAARVRAGLDPRALAGAAALGTVEGLAHVLDADSVVVWAAHLDGGRARVVAARGLPDGSIELPAIGRLAPPSVAVVLADQYTIRVDALLAALHARAPAVPVVGGVLSVRPRDDAPVFVRGDEARAAGAIVVLLEGVEALPVVAGGAVPLGAEHEVTAGARNVISRLGGRPAAEALTQTLDALAPGERTLIDGGARIGVLRGAAPSRPWTTHYILDVDAVRGTVTIGGAIEPGDAVRLHAFDRRAADRRLRDAARLCRRALAGERPAGVLSFVCASREAGPAGPPHRDAAELLSELGAGTPHAGFLASGEIGPSHGAPYLHGFTAASAVFPAHG